MPMGLLLSVAQTADILGISERSLYGLWQRQAGPPTVLIGGRRMVRQEAVRTWLEAQERQVFAPRVVNEPAAP